MPSNPFRAGMRLCRITDRHKPARRNRAGCTRIRGKRIRAKRIRGKRIRAARPRRQADSGTAAPPSGASWRLCALAAGSGRGISRPARAAERPRETADSQ